MAPTRKPAPREPREPRNTRRADAPPSGAANGGSGGGTSSGAATAPPTPTFRGADKKLHDGLTGFYASVGMGAQAIASMRGDLGLLVAGANITVQSSAVADAWVELAQTNPRVRTTLEGFIQGTSVATLVGLHASMILPVLASRGVVPEEVAAMFVTAEARQVTEEYITTAAARAAAANGNGAHN